MSSTDPMPSAEIVFDTLFAYQKSAALKTAIDLELFTAIDDGAHTAAALSVLSVGRQSAAAALHGKASVLRSIAFATISDSSTLSRLSSSLIFASNSSSSYSMGLGSHDSYGLPRAAGKTKPS